MEIQDWKDSRQQVINFCFLLQQKGYHRYAQTHDKMLSMCSKRLSEADSIKIQVLTQEKLSNVQISLKVGCSVTTIKKWKNRPFGKIKDAKRK